MIRSSIAAVGRPLLRWMAVPALGMGWAAAAWGQLLPGDAVVADAGASAATSGIIHVSASTGNRTFLTGNGAGSGAAIDTPEFVVVSPGGIVYYIEQVASGTANQVISVSASGLRTQVTSVALTTPTGMAWDSTTDSLIVSDAGSSPTTSDIISIDPVTGNQTIVTGNGSGTGAAIDTPSFPAVGSTGTIYYIETVASGTANHVVSVNPASGLRTALPGTPVVDPTGMVWDPNTSLLVLSDAGASSATSGILSVNPASGASAFITGNGTGAGVNLDTPESAASTTPGVIYYYELVDASTAENVVKVVGGIRSVLSGSFGGVGTGPPFVSIFSLAAVSTPPAPVITSGAVVSGTAGGAFSYTITATNSPGSFSVSGALPSDVTLNTASGLISGTPGSPGTFNVTIGATNLGGPATGPLAITINSALVISPASLAAATAGTLTSQAIAVTGGTAPLTGLSVTGFSSGGTGLTAGALTTNLSTGVVAVSGTPTVPGTVTFAVHASDSGGALVSQNYSLVVTAGAATHFVVSAPATATAGTSVSVSVTAKDALNNTATGYTGSVHFTSSDGAALLPANAVLTSGAGSFAATFDTAGAQSVSATDTVSPSITGVSGTVTVGAGATALFVVSAPTSATAGTSVSVSVTAKDAFNNTVTGYAGTVHFTSTDGTATLPANAVLSSGTGLFPVTLHTSGSQTVTATDTVTSSITGSSGTISVGGGAATHFAVSAPATATAGTSFSVTVTARDGFNNTAVGYSGVVHFASTGGIAALPADSALTGGVGTFPVTLNTAGARTVTATDTAASSINGVSGTIVVAPGAVTQLAVAGVSTTAAGAPFSVTVSAKDASNNTVPTYSGTVHFTSTDPRAGLPANAGLTGGTKVFTVTLDTAGPQSVTATDTVSSAVTGNSGTIGVVAGSVATLSISAPGSATVGSAVSVTVTALDAFENMVSSYSGTVHFTSSDPAAILPSDSAVTGSGSFAVTFATAGMQTVTGTDTVTASIMGVSGAVAVGAAVTPTPTPTPEPTPLPVPPPVIVTQPLSQTVNAGASAVFSVTASNMPSTYQWKFNGAPIAGATSALFVLSNAQASNVGQYTVTITNASGQVTSSAAVLTVSASGTGTPPSFVLQPTSQTMATGSTVVFNALADGTSPVAYQWFWNDSAVAGAVDPTFVVAGATAANDGSYLCVATNSSGSAISSPATLGVITTNNPGRPINISCRAQVGTGVGQLIIGFVVGGQGGPGPLSLLVRASGPALASFGVTGTLPDPSLELNNMSGVLATNDGWAGNAQIAAAAASVGAFPWTSPSSLDSALLESLAPGPYTVVISGAKGDTGVVLAEVYDTTIPNGSGQTASRLINLSSRAQVGTGSGVLIAGFVVGGSTSKTVLIRASGPALAPFGLTGVLADPQLQLNGAGGLLATNNGWAGNAEVAATAASVGAFSWSNPASHDSALLVTLAPGAYTAVVSGASGDTGVSLVEVYEVP